MAIVLHRFPLSHFSEKGRALLDFKGLDYTIVEHTLGLPQLRIVKLSGQRQVPVIEHDGRVVSDSTRIARYLDEAFPDRRRLVPLDDPRRSEVLALEDRIDHVFGIGAPLLWFEDAVHHRDQTDLFAIEIYGMNVLGARAFAAAVRSARGLGLGQAFVDKWRARTLDLLRDLARRLERSPYLVGDEPTLADVAAVGLTLHLEFPRSRHFVAPQLAGRAVTEVTEDPTIKPFFEWRRKFYEKFLT
jgi:glutathione S-transferase